MTRKEYIKSSVFLTKEQKEILVNDLIKNGEVSIGGLITIKLKTVTMKGRERIDPYDISKGFRITDVNKKHTTIQSSVSMQFKKVVKNKMLA